MSRATLAALGSEPSATGLVAVLAALRREIAPLEARMTISQRFRAGNLRGCAGRLNGVGVVTACTGDGIDNAARGAQTLFERYPVSRVIIVGIAGGLSPALPTGSLLVARAVLEDSGSVPAPDALWVERARRDTGATPALFVSRRDILCTVRDKADAYASLHDAGVAAVDLETATFARAAAQRGLPYLALRAISDPAEESLPLDFNALRDRTGAVDNRRVTLRALRRPSLLPYLWDWRRRVSLCSESLAQAVQTLLSGEYS